MELKTQECFRHGYRAGHLEESMMVARGRIDCATGPNKSLQVHVNVSLRLSSRHGATHRAVASLFAFRIAHIDLNFSVTPRVRTRQPVYGDNANTAKSTMRTVSRGSPDLGTTKGAGECCPCGSVTLKVFKSGKRRAAYRFRLAHNVTVRGFHSLISGDVFMELG